MDRFTGRYYRRDYEALRELIFAIRDGIVKLYKICSALGDYFYLKGKDLTDRRRYKHGLMYLKLSLNRRYKVYSKQRAYVAIIDNFYGQGKHAEAIEVANEALKDNGQYVKVKLALAQLYDRCGKDMEARLAYSEILRDHPDNVAINEYYGMKYLRKKEYAEALKHYEKITSRSPRNTNAGVKLVQCYRQTDRYDEAIREVNRLLDLGYVKYKPLLAELEGAIQVS